MFIIKQMNLLRHLRYKEIQICIYCFRVRIKGWKTLKKFKFLKAKRLIFNLNFVHQILQITSHRKLLASYHPLVYIQPWRACCARFMFPLSLKALNCGCSKLTKIYFSSQSIFADLSHPIAFFQRRVSNAIKISLVFPHGGWKLKEIVALFSFFTIFACHKKIPRTMTLLIIWWSEQFWGRI